MLENLFGRLPLIARLRGQSLAVLINQNEIGNAIGGKFSKSLAPRFVILHRRPGHLFRLNILFHRLFVTICTDKNQLKIGMLGLKVVIPFHKFGREQTAGRTPVSGKIQRRIFRRRLDFGAGEVAANSFKKTGMNAGRSEKTQRGNDGEKS